MSDKATEIKVGTPTNFDGNLNNASRWLYSLIAYISLNNRIYTSPKKKIILTLSFMNKGSATTWAEAAYEKTADDETLKLGNNHKKEKIPFETQKPRTPSPKVRKTEIPTPDLISAYAKRLKKKKNSQKEILDVLKTCFDDEEEGGKDEETAQSIRISIGLFATEEGRIVDTHTLLDCGAGRLSKLLKPQNVDGSNNIGGWIKYSTTITVCVADVEEE
ncbi:hypothetical protein PAXRUDRAFT_14990 [Paxillus rubicundulus Ve08.2h10]|uniref:DUF4939 domain-containing protein n=1 Tax=Paxillus rubicundulus Ve08.2h10 TaxID=930991 RepID=A0A0D0D1I8_9AGAM|nr:hypothetical protein PAXRUDRAFT_14990 [Paxillus rubicundulus Ve08.2h10]